jgi:hypothetical protein
MAQFMENDGNLSALQTMLSSMYCSIKELVWNDYFLNLTSRDVRNLILYIDYIVAHAEYFKQEPYRMHRYSELLNSTERRIRYMRNSLQNQGMPEELIEQIIRKVLLDDLANAVEDEWEPETNFNLNCVSMEFDPRVVSKRPESLLENESYRNVDAIAEENLREMMTITNQLNQWLLNRTKEDKSRLPPFVIDN